MRAIVGIDLDGLYVSAINILSRLRIEETCVELVHVDETPPAYPDGDQSWTPDFLEVQQKFDESIMFKAEKLATEKGFSHSTLVVLGNPADVLMDRATATFCDLIAVGSTMRSKFASLFFGSVGRALTIGAHQSVLISKGKGASKGPLTVLVTTDHSEYADRAIATFASMRPKGINRLVLITALNDKLIGHVNKGKAIEIEEYMRSKSNYLVNNLNEVGIPSEYRIIPGELDAVINEQMSDIDADFLIMGAQGHGFIDRILIGSNSLRQVVASQHSVLLLRPKTPTNLLSA